MDRTKPLVIYDGDCGICKKCVAWVKHQNGGDCFAYESYQSLSSSGRLADLGVTEAECQQAMQLILPDGQVASGADGVAEIFSRLKWLKALGLVMKLPLVNGSARVAYRFFAKNRKRFGSTCEL